MRFHLLTDTRPKAIAGKLSDAFRDAGREVRRTEALDITASVYGYRNWRDLTRHLGRHGRSPEDDACDAAIVKMRRDFHVQVLLRHGLPNPAARDFVQRVGLTGSTGPDMPKGFPHRAEGSISIPSLDRMGFTPAQRRALTRSLALRRGLAIACGPTGSGKSIVTAWALSILAKTQAIVTVEDPPEYRIEGAVQIRVPSSPGDRNGALRLAFSEAEGHSPDVLMTSDLRSRFQAGAVMASASQRLTWTHVLAKGVRDVPDILRSLKMDDAEGDVQGTVALLVGLRLVPMLCTRCSHPGVAIDRYAKYPYATSLLHMGMRSANADGCPHCTYGLCGRTQCAEVIEASDPDYEDWIADPWSAPPRRGLSAFEHAIALAHAGAISPEAALLAYDEDDAHRLAHDSARLAWVREKALTD